MPRIMCCPGVTPGMWQKHPACSPWATCPSPLTILLRTNGDHLTTGEDGNMKADLGKPKPGWRTFTIYMPEGLDLKCEQRSELSSLPLLYRQLPHLALCWENCHYKESYRFVGMKSGSRQVHWQLQSPCFWRYFNCGKYQSVLKVASLAG